MTQMIVRAGRAETADYAETSEIGADEEAAAAATAAEADEESIGFSSTAARACSLGVCASLLVVMGCTCASWKEEAEADASNEKDSSSIWCGDR